MSNHWKQSILEVFRVAPVQGDIGIEIEMEGYCLPHFEGGDHNWRAVADGSLRGESMEYVMKKPVSMKHVHTHLIQLYEEFKNRDSELHPSDRCGVHVHINVQTYTQAQVLNIVTLYYILEEVLMTLLPAHRQGNMFCLRGMDAVEQMYILRKAVSRGSWLHIAEDQVRYAAINLGSLGKYGSLEFRAYPTTDDWRPINDWVKYLYAIVQKAIQYDEPRHIVENMSAAGDALLNDVFGWELAQPLHGPKVGQMLMRGARLVQALAYTHPGDWLNEIADDIPWEECPHHDEEDDWFEWLSEYNVTPADYWNWWDEEQRKPDNEPQLPPLPEANHQWQVVWHDGNNIPVQIQEEDQLDDL